MCAIVSLIRVTLKAFYNFVIHGMCLEFYSMWHFEMLARDAGTMGQYEQEIKQAHAIRFSYWTDDGFACWAELRNKTEERSEAS